MRTLRIIIFFLVLTGYTLADTPKGFCDREDNKKSDPKKELSKEELDIIKHLSMLENLEYLEEEDLSFLENYQNVTQATEDGGQDDE